jgi:hypothetical protein
MGRNIFQKNSIKAHRWSLDCLMCVMNAFVYQRMSNCIFQIGGPIRDWSSLDLRLSEYVRPWNTHERRSVAYHVSRSQYLTSKSDMQIVVHHQLFDCASSPVLSSIRFNQLLPSLSCCTEKWIPILSVSASRKAPPTKTFEMSASSERVTCLMSRPTCISALASDALFLSFRLFIECKCALGLLEL